VVYVALGALVVGRNNNPEQTNKQIRPSIYILSVCPVMDVGCTRIALTGPTIYCCCQSVQKEKNIGF
jgi:hypothetical protein